MRPAANRRARSYALRQPPPLDELEDDAALLDDELEDDDPVALAHPTASGSLHAHGTHAEPIGSTWQPAPTPQSAPDWQPMCVQKFSSCPRSARQMVGIGVDEHSPPLFVQYLPTPMSLP
jgi:hypothetical protein